MLMPKKVATPALILTFMAILLSSCGSKKEEKKEATAATTPAYQTMQLQTRQITGDVQLPGEMQPFQQVQLYPKINGFVKSVLVDRGSIVRAGQTLITLDAPEIAQQSAAARLKYTQAQAAYLTSRDRYERVLETSKTPGTISAFDLAAAASKKQGDSAMAQGEYADFKATEAMKSYLTVTAPFDGIITERNVHPGALAGPGAQNAKPMLVLQQLSMLRLTVAIPEQYAAQVHDGDKVKYKVNAIPGTDFTGTVSRSSESLTNNFRSETIEIDVDNTKNQYKPGMFAEVTLPTSGNGHAFVVPKTAIVTTTERKYVVSVVYNITRWVNITEGNQSSDSTEIFGELQPGDEVITNANYQIKEGQAVK